MALTTADLQSRASIDHQVEVTNTGTIAGDCVVMAFAVAQQNFHGTNRDEVGAPLKSLFGFQRLHDMAPGEKRSVLFSSTADDLSIVDTGGHRWLKKRRFSIEIGDVLVPARREVVVEGNERLLEAAGPWADVAAAYLSGATSK